MRQLTIAGLLALALAGCSATDGAGALPDLGAALDARGPDVRAVSDTGAPLVDGGGVVRPDARSCAPLPPKPNIALFTTLERDLAALTGAARRRARVDRFFTDVAASGRYPVQDGGGVVFLLRTTARAVSVAGTFNSWKADVDKLAHFADTDLFYLKKTVGPARVEYKFVEGGTRWLRDPKSPHVAWDRIKVAGLGGFNSVVPPWAAPDPAGRLEHLRVASPQLSDTRDVFVFLPAEHDRDRCARLPLLFINDGNESIARAQLDAKASAAFRAKKAQPAVLAFVALSSQNVRLSEYSPAASSRGPRYTTFLCDTLAPLLDKRYRTRGTADTRGIAGASLGGLISVAAAFWRDNCLRLVGSMSGSFFYVDSAMIKRIKSSTIKLKIARIYLDNGTDNRQVTHDARDALRAKGYAVHHTENLSHAHTWGAWRDRFEGLLAYLLPPKP